MNNIDDILNMEIDDDQDKIDENTHDEDFDIMNMETDEPYMEMATIISQNGISIKVNQKVKHLSIAYFKVFNNVKFSSADKVARLHFKDSGIEIHESDPSGKKIWIPNSGDIKNIKSKR